MQQHQNADPRGFLVSDLHVQVNADLPQLLGCHVNEWPGQVFQALSKNEAQVCLERSSQDPQDHAEQVCRELSS